MTDSKIKEVVEQVNVADPKSISEAANVILEDTHVKAGQDVAVIDDPSWPAAGRKGKVKSVKGGYAEVELPNGSTMPMQVSLLVPVK